MPDPFTRNGRRLSTISTWPLGRVSGAAQERAAETIRSTPMALRSAAQMLAGSLRDLAPIVVVVAFFQLVVLREPFPNLSEILLGLGAVAVGLALFIRGLEMSLFPIGDSMAEAFARKGSLFWLLAFAFALGVGTTVAEPALIAVADEAARVRASGASAALDAGDRDFALGLRYTVAAAVGLALVLGVMRIIRGWALYKLIIGGYLLVVVLTQFAPREIVGIAYDSGGVNNGHGHGAARRRARNRPVRCDPRPQPPA